MPTAETLATCLRRICVILSHTRTRARTRALTHTYTYKIKWFYWNILNLRKLNELEVKEQYQIEITNTFAALEDLDVDEDVNRDWENIKENIKTSAKESLGLHELKQNKPWFDTECFDFLDQRKQA